MRDWPYPFWIAHRGGGALAPENTLAAFRRGYDAGWRMFECDVQLSADGVPFLLHDLALQRTTNGTGLAHEKPWAELAQLDAGSRYAPGHAGEPLPTLAQVADFCLQRPCFINLEIKPPPSRGFEVGQVVTRQAARLWRGAPVPPLLSSFDAEALRAAHQEAPELPRARVFERLRRGWLQQCLDLDCVAVVAEYPQWNPHTVARARAAGLRVLSYTVNRASVAHRLVTLGTQGIIGDCWLAPRVHPGATPQGNS